MRATQTGSNLRNTCAPLGRLRRTNRPSAFSLIEVLVVIAIIVLLLAILLPSIGRAKDQVRRVMCRNNLRQWGVAVQLYRGDHKDYLPTEGPSVPTVAGINKPNTWYNVLPPYLGAPAYKDVEGAGVNIREFPALHVWICPAKNLGHLNASTTGKNQFHYGMNRVLDGTGDPPYGGSLTPGFPDEGDDAVQASRFMGRPKTVYMFDIYANYPNGDPTDVATEFHRDSANVLYVDGAVAGDFKATDFVENGDWSDGDPIWRNPRLYWGFLPH